MRELAQLVRSSEAWLLARVKSYADAQGPMRHADPLCTSWGASVAKISEVLLKSIAKGMPALKTGAGEAAATSPLADFAAEAARQHKERGAAPGMLVGCLSFYRQSFLDLVAQSQLADTPKQKATSFISRFFDRLLADVADAWCSREETFAQQAVSTGTLRDTGVPHDQLRETSIVNRLSMALSEEAESEAALLKHVADFLPLWWDAPADVSVLIRFDGQEYASANAPARHPGQPLTESLTVLGEVRGVLQLCPRHANWRFQSGDASMLSAIARQLEHGLESRLSLALLRQSERQFREFFDNAADAIFVHDETGCILDANKTAGNWLSLSRESLSCTNLLETFTENERESVAGRFKNALRGSPELFDATIMRRDGFPIPAEFLCQAQEFQGRKMLISSGRNITSRLRAQEEIERRLETEALVSAISGRLINSGEEDMTRAIEDSLADLCDFLGMRRAAVFLYDSRKRAFILTYQQRVHLEAPLPKSLHRLGPGKAPWFTERILANERVFIRYVGHMPPAAHKEKALLTQVDIACLAALPMRVKDKLLGVLVMASNFPMEPARVAEARVLGQLALLFSNAIERQHAGAALRQSEGLARAILNALPANLCVLDRRGVLTMVNSSWAETGPESTPLGGAGARLGLGGNYLDACRAAPDNAHAAAVLEGILAVLSRKTPSFRTEYPAGQRATALVPAAGRTLCQGHGRSGGLAPRHHRTPASPHRTQGERGTLPRHRGDGPGGHHHDQRRERDYLRQPARGDAVRLQRCGAARDTAFTHPGPG